MNERIKQVRKLNGLNQTDFAASLQVPLATIQSYEYGRRTPSSAFISLLCSKYSINENWLINGTGEMKISLDREAEIAAIASRMYKGDDEFKFQLVKILYEMSDEEQELFKNIIKKIAKTIEKAPE